MPSSENASTQYGDRFMTKKKEPVRSAPALFQSTLLALLRFHQSHFCGGAASVTQNLVVVQVTVGRITASHATVIAEERQTSVRRIDHCLLQNLNTVADVALDVEQVRRAATPFTTV